MQKDRNSIAPAVCNYKVEISIPIQVSRGNSHRARSHSVVKGKREHPIAISQAN